MKDTYLNVDYMDLSEGNFYDEKYLVDKFNEILDLFGRYKLVVTDRLHGMIFSFITETPCIAMRNYNHKVESFYEWFDNVEYISLAENVNDVENMAKKFENVNLLKPHEIFEKEFDKLKEIINDKIKEE